MILTHRGHRLDIARRVLPVDPDRVKPERRDEPGGLNGAQAEVDTNKRGDFTLMGIAQCLTGPMWLE